MPKQLTWTDSDDIGILLSETHPELDPRSQTKPSWKQFRWRGTRKFSTAPRARTELESQRAPTVLGAASSTLASRRNFAASSGGVGLM
jgi:hypothetical protein